MLPAAAPRAGIQVSRQRLAHLGRNLFHRSAPGPPGIDEAGCADGKVPARPNPAPPMRLRGALVAPAQRAMPKPISAAESVSPGGSG